MLSNDASPRRQVQGEKYWPKFRTMRNIPSFTASFTFATSHHSTIQPLDSHADRGGAFEEHIAGNCGKPQETTQGLSLSVTSCVHLQLKSNRGCSLSSRSHVCHRKWLRPLYDLQTKDQAQASGAHDS